MSLSFRTCCALAVTAGLISVSNTFGQVSTDTFGSGANQFTIDFVTISGDAGDLGSWWAGHTFMGVNRGDYRIGVYEITNDQWNKFKADLGVPLTGSPSSAYEDDPFYSAPNVPTNNVSWLEAAQFVNWLNTSTGHHPAYKFTGTQGTADYTFAAWGPNEAAGGTNFFRHKDAFYFLPTDDEWVKAAYWNGTSLQIHATTPGDTLHQGDGVSGSGWNYWDSGYSTDPAGPWNVGSGSEELNGTHDMMGNVWEWTESPFSPANFGTESQRVVRGGSYYGTFFSFGDFLASSQRSGSSPQNEFSNVGFRVAAEIPEPASLSILALGGLALLRRRVS